MYKIYSKKNCVSCDNAENYLSYKGFSYEKLVLDEDFDIIEFFDIVPKGTRSFPAIFKGEEFVGGFDSLKKFL